MSTTKYLCTAFLFMLAIGVNAQTKYPANVEVVLQKTKSNRPELEKVINHYNIQVDSLKRKAAYFLIANMDIHNSNNYYWADSNNKKVEFNELDYPNFDSSISAFEIFKKQVPKIHPIPFSYLDIDSMKADFLIDNIDQAFDLWKNPWAKNLSFEDFCEYLLPYRVVSEPLQDWRNKYKTFFKNVIDSSSNLSVTFALNNLTANCHTWFTNTFNIEKRNEPLPHLGPLQLLTRKQGACEDFTALGVFAARIMGIAASYEYIPAWATSTNSHMFDAAIFSKDSIIPFECLLSPVTDFTMNANREPGKVVRITYSKQPDVLANYESKENIPSGFMRNYNYKDVTSNYWKVQDVHSNLFTKPIMPKKVYACVLNGLAWKPIWWGNVQNDTTNFLQMGKGATYLPMYYLHNKLEPAGYPIAVGYNHTAVLNPDTINTRTIQLTEQDKYLKYRPAKRYSLYYWNNQWMKIAEQVTSDDTHKLIFDKVPNNALLLMIPEYSQKKERPFIITEEGKRVWW